MSQRRKKVLIIGAKGYQMISKEIRVECRLWSDIGKIKNIRDYDTLVLDLLQITENSRRQGVKWDKFGALLDFHSTADILFNGGMIIVVGDPRFSVGGQKGKEVKRKGISEPVPFLKWTGITFDWDSEPGDTLVFKDDYEHRKFTDYVEKIGKWEYSLGACRIDMDVLSQRFNLDYIRREEREMRLARDYFCCNRYKNALAFTLRYHYCDLRYGREEVLEASGPMLFLPALSISEDETLQLILACICGIEADLPEPEWLSEFSAPGQNAVDAEITQIEGELQTQLEQLDRAHHQQAERRKCLRLLYEREYGLEPVVRDTLRGLGAHVEDPTEKNKEDGWVVVKVGNITYEGVLEIKSTRSDSFGEDGRKQLLDWIDRGRTLREKKYKGIFIGNSAVDKPLTERPWAFGDSWTKAAELSGICAMKTEDLYVIHLLKARGLVELDIFWKDIFETNGVFDLRRYSEMLSPKEDSS